MGADDDLPKPFGFVELQARIRAVLRRAEMPSVKAQSSASAPVHRLGSVVVNLDTHQVSRRAVDVALTPTEFRLLEYFLRHPGQVLSHHQLLTGVWGFAYSDATELLTPTISRLRQKIEDEPGHPHIIQTVHGFGYRLVPPAPPDHTETSATTSGDVP